MNDKKTVRIGGIVLGEGLPKICVPLTGDSPEAFAQQASAAKDAADLLEVRIDALSPSPSPEEAAEVLRAVRTAAPGLPILFTLRTKRDGGNGTADLPEYETLLCRAAQSGLADAVDAELSCGEELFRRIAERCHACGIPVVGSSHEFGQIVSAETAADWLKQQEQLGADICKAAVMAHSRQEALTLASTFCEADEQLRCPYIGIVMGKDGVFSRVLCGWLGSCLTFGTAGRASAPGQPDASALRGILSRLDEIL